MPRGDCGKTVFEDDKDRHGWVDLREKACARSGWRMHPCVVMGNHFHLLPETPEPNLAPDYILLNPARSEWATERLGMSHEGNVTRAIRRVNEHPGRKINLQKLKAMLVSRNESS